MYEEFLCFVPFSSTIGKDLASTILTQLSFSKWCTCTICWPNEISWCVDKCIIEGWWLHSETSEITILWANKLRGTFDQCSPAVKNTLFRAYCVPMYACQLWSKYTQTSIKRLRAAYNNAYRTVHYIPRNVSVRPHQVSHCVRTFDAVLRNNLYRFFIRCTSSSNFFIRSLQMFDAFHKSSFFLNYSTLLNGRDRMQQLLVSCFGICVSSVLLLCSKNMWTLCTHQALKKARSAGKVFCASQGWTRTNTGCVMPYCMVIHFLYSCEWRYSCGEDKLLCSSQCWSCANTVSVMCADV